MSNVVQCVARADRFERFADASEQAVDASVVSLNFPDIPFNQRTIRSAPAITIDGVPVFRCQLSSTSLIVPAALNRSQSWLVLLVRMSIAWLALTVLLLNL